MTPARDPKQRLGFYLCLRSVVEGTQERKRKRRKKRKRKKRKKKNNNINGNKKRKFITSIKVRESSEDIRPCSNGVRLMRAP